MKWEPMLGELSQRRRGRLVAFATVLAGPDLAEDLVHDAVIATFTRSRHFSSVEQAEAYVRRAIATRYIDLVRKDRARSARERRTALYEVAPDVAGVGPMSADVARALATLSPQVRACIALRFLEDMSIRSTADALNLSEGAVKRYVSDGLARLNEQLGTHEELDIFDDAEVRAVVGHAPSKEVSK